jgi:hypothetical protein
MECVPMDGGIDGPEASDAPTVTDSSDAADGFPADMNGTDTAVPDAGGP